MVTRRRREPEPAHDPARSAARMEEMLARLTGRFEQQADDLDARLGRIEKDVAEGRLGQERLRSELAEARNDSGELRDGLSDLRKEVDQMRREQPIRVAAGAAEGAAHGAGLAAKEAVAPALASEVAKKLWNHWLAKTGVGGVALMAFVAVVQNAGPVVRATESAAIAAWTWLKGL